MTAVVSIRPATQNDEQFAYLVTARTMRGYVERTWGSFDEAAARANAASMIATGAYAIVRSAGDDIGVLHVERDRGDIWLAHLFLLPEHQRQGIGTHLLRELKCEAAEARKPLRLRVLTVNPARRLYEREGFTIFTATFGRTYMQWLPEGLDVPASAGSCPPEVRAVLDGCGITADMIAERYLVVQPEASEFELVAREPSGREHLLAPAAASAWRQMRAAATAQGLALEVVSAFRSVVRQARIIRAKLDRGETMKQILKVSAPPGYSEHHTGLAVDLGTTDVPPLSPEFANSRAFAWLCAHAGSFGFRLSFPQGNPYGYQYEPWHWCFRD